MMRALWLVMICVGLAACNQTSERAVNPETPPAGVATADPYLAKVQAFRDKHETDYKRDWVSIAGLHFLEPGTHSVGRDVKNDVVLVAAVPATIGQLVVAGTSVKYQPAPGVEVTIKGQPITGPVMLKEEGQPPTTEFVIGDVRMVIHMSGERLSLRVRDPNGPLAKDFRGFSWFPIDPANKVTGKFVADPTPTNKTVLNTLGDMDTYATEGVIEFTLQGQTLRLRPFTTRPKRFYIVFRDASAGEETYETARFLYADLQDDGTTVLDFNEAYNPPCSFNPYTTCPIPLKENILPVKVLAGEKAYPIHVSIPATP
ncbi:MAG TPA: DUF1684 domain-containing protein [Vicinamibacterales bacterium]|nr:DUF1684 domain-containing protein [Vicinamibacterales bacterium]